MPLDGDVKKFEVPGVEHPVPEVVRVLRKAAEVIRERGWCRGHPKGRAVCMAKAVTIAHGIRFDENYQLFRNSAAGSYLMEYMGRTYPLPERFHTEKVWGWNDEPGRTKEQVLAALEGAAKQYLEKGNA